MPTKVWQPFIWRISCPCNQEMCTQMFRAVLLTAKPLEIHQVVELGESREISGSIGKVRLEDFLTDRMWGVKDHTKVFGPSHIEGYVAINFGGDSCRKNGFGRADKEFGLGHQVQCLVGMQVEISNRPWDIGIWNSGERLTWNYKFGSHQPSDGI